MYARVVRNQIQPGMMGEWLAIIRGCIVPSLEERDGFVVRHLIRPRYAGDFLRLVRDFTAATRAGPGCLSFEWSRSTGDPGVCFLVEAFRDAAAGQAHVGSDHFKAAIARMPGLLAGAPEIVRADLPVGGWSRMAELQPAGQ